MRESLFGANATLSHVAAVFFLPFLRQSGDRLQAYFSLAFAIFAAYWIDAAFTPPNNEALQWSTAFGSSPSRHSLWPQ